MASIQRLLFVVDLVLLHQKQTLTLNLNIIILLLRRALLQAATSAKTAFLGSRGALWLRSSVIDSMDAATTLVGDILAFLLLLFLTLLSPNLIDVKKLNGNQIAFQSAVAVFAPADEDIGIEIGCCDVRITAILFVDTEDTRDQLAVGAHRRL